MRKILSRLPRLSRGQKILKNLVVILVCGFICWGWLGYPMPTDELEFRRLERKLLLDHGGTLYPIVVAGEDYFISASDTWVNVGKKGASTLRGTSVAENGSLVPINNARRDLGEYAVLAVGVPDTAATAELTLDLSAWSYEWYQSDVSGKNIHLIEISRYFEGDADKYTYRHYTWDYRIAGEKLGPGVFLFRLSPQGKTENKITGSVEDLAERRAMNYITDDYRLGEQRPDRGGLTELVFRSTFYDREGNEVGQLRLAPLEKFDQTR